MKQFYLMKFLFQGSPRQQQLMRTGSGSELDGHCHWQSFWMTKTNQIFEQSPELQNRSMNVPIQVGNHVTITSGILLLMRSSLAGLGRSATANVTGI